MKWAQTEEVLLHGSRIRNVMAALAIRQPQVKSGIVYAGAEQLAEMAGVCERTVRRAIVDLVALGGASPILITRPNPCDGEHCRYVKRACPGVHGGKTLDEDGRPTGAATGYSINPSWVHAVRHLRLAPGRAPGQPTKAQSAEEHEAALRALQRRQAATDAAAAADPVQNASPAAAGPLAGALDDLVGRLPARGRDP